MWVFGNCPLYHLVVCFFEFLTPFTSTGHNFLNSIPFFTISNAPNVPIRKVQVLFRHIKQWSLPLRSSLLWMFKCYSCNSIATNKQLKDLTHMFCFWMPCYKLYKESLFSYVLTLKYMCHFGMSFKKLNLRAKHNFKNKINHIYYLVHLVLCFPTYLLR